MKNKESDRAGPSRASATWTSLLQGPSASCSTSVLYKPNARQRGHQPPWITVGHLHFLCKFVLTRPRRLNESSCLLTQDRYGNLRCNVITVPGSFVWKLSETKTVNINLALVSSIFTSFEIFFFYNSSSCEVYIYIYIFSILLYALYRHENRHAQAINHAVYVDRVAFLPRFDSLICIDRLYA